MPKIGWKVQLKNKITGDNKSMTYKIDISNAAYSLEYVNRRNKTINETYNKKYKTGEEKDKNNDLEIIHEYYRTKDNNYCEYNKIYRNNNLLHEYFNLDEHRFFCEYIKYSNGSDYV
ncbi:MAG: hypothetical protein LBC20_08065, partial [Planctomycetaceae bacterium]|nr:hypothetical protein [Planctomycetaceae bacterium]